MEHSKALMIMDQQEGPRCSRHYHVEVPSAHEGLVLPIAHDDLGVRARREDVAQLVAERIHAVVARGDGGDLVIAL